jgi:hypothetical protein
MILKFQLSALQQAVAKTFENEGYKVIRATIGAS